MAHTKAQGGVKGNRDSIAKRLGIKLYAGEKVQPGNIIVRQRGTKMAKGDGVRVGRDHTLYAVTTGKVKFGQKFGKKVVSVVS